MALAATAPVARPRRAAVLLLAAGLVASAAFADPSSVLSGYPFLKPAIPHAPDVLYTPFYAGSDGIASSMTIGTEERGFRYELTTQYAWGELRIWESNLYGARVEDAVPAIVEEGTVSDALGVEWHRARTPDGRRNVLYARLGATLVVLISDGPWDQLLRIADSLRPTTPRALIL